MSAPPPSSPVLEEALVRRRRLLDSQHSGRTAMACFCLALVLLYDANHCLLLSLLTSQPLPFLSSLLYCLELLLFALCLTQGLSRGYTLLAPLHGLSPLALTEAQYRLLRLHPESPGFTRSPPPKAAPSPPSSPFTPLAGPLLDTSSLPPSPSSPCLSVTPVNLSNTSWLSEPASPGSPASPPTLPSNQRREYFSPSLPRGPITEEEQLESYLADYRQWEASHSLPASSVDDSGSQSSSSILYWRAAGPADSSPAPAPLAPLPTVFQLSCPVPPTSGSSPGGCLQPQEEGEGCSKVEAVLTHRLGITGSRLGTWNQNLRVWLTQTVLRPLVSEVERINGILPRLGLQDSLVGGVGVERLRKVAGSSLSPEVGSLSALLPYLEVCPDQGYTMARLRQLAKTGALSEFRWAKGGSQWSDRLPTDSELLAHWLACYLDSRLLPSMNTRMAREGDQARPFTGVHFFKYGEKVAPPAGAAGAGEPAPDPLIALVQVGRSPPHYVLQVGAKQLEVGGGRNNLLYSLLLFLHTVKQERHGMLGRVNLGISGLNILWVID